MDSIYFAHRLSFHNFELPWHFENAYQILIVLRGRISYTVQDNDYELGEKGIIVLNTMEKHSLKVLEYPYERVMLRIEPSRFYEEIKEPELMSIFIKRTKEFKHAISVTDDAWENIKNSFFVLEKEYKNPDKYSDLMIWSEIRKIFASLYRGSSMKNDSTANSMLAVVSSAMNYMNKHFTEEITVDDLASVVMKSRDYLSHIFSKTTGLSIKQYLIRLRINHAKFLLSESEKNISEIAEECGYNDMNFFSRQFQSSTKMSPTSFRKLVRAQNSLGKGNIE